ncbi:MAG: succinate dehydrogenase/fumarate reductase iron-sulfur subunit [Flavobacterium lindanitolerans]|uniref:succinate dehydrogenase/fumarate reductase iron-sulfur subunit n=1 Tax=Flavobacterium lindanitolerans TaxID=428988 RepID=UPI001A5ABD90|nr:succinate dehydrogenase/fumarate reductase iron-sulfur subunit [Flavobacterium lindanitolerans]MBL7868483.1 succinate dehydrogenase/fumarate reductase iron-sulfur subunit [Flavobacterium lindanitolerans]
MDLHLKIWRQKDRQSEGKLVNYDLTELNPHMSFLEMLDTLNEKLILEGDEPVEFDHDCREGICGQCGMMINGIAHGPLKQTTTCQLHLRSFKDGETILIEPFRAEAFPVKKDLKVDRSAFDRIISSGGFVSINTGQAPDATAIAITHQTAEEAFDAAACIGCGACVATCKNASAALFTSAKITHMVSLPQGKEERSERVLNMVRQMDAEHFGHCSNTEACEVECPQGISVLSIATMNYEYNRALFLRKNKY